MPFKKCSSHPIEAQLHCIDTFISRDPCCSIHSIVHHSEKYSCTFLQMQMQAKIIVDLSYDIANFPTLPDMYTDY